MKRTIVIVIALVVVVGGMILLVKGSPKTATAPTVSNGNLNTTTNSSTNSTNASLERVEFSPPTKSAHYESNTPAHGSVLAAPPTNVVIDFNFDLSTKSSISIVKGGKEYGVGGTTVDQNKLALRRSVDPNAPDGVYTVSYTACWPDNSCHNGNFGFAIDRTRTTSSTDLRNQSEVTVRLSQISFVPMDIRISRGTTVVWVNDDDVEHYVNTDSHPAHTYFQSQNSGALKKGDTFRQRFDTAGAYPYHCSAHAATMTGSVVVE